MVIELDLSLRNSHDWPRPINGPDDELGGVAHGFVVALPLIWVRVRWREELTPIVLGTAAVLAAIAFHLYQGA